MKKILFLIPVFLLASVYPDFRPCLIKYSYIKNEIPVTKTKSVTFGKNGCVNYDPFTGMCVINSHNKKIVKFFNKAKLGWWVASIKKNEIYVGNYAKKGNFLSPSFLSVKTAKNSVITDMFCRAVGIGDGNGFIKEDLVKHFIKYGYWGDVGIDVDENMKIVSFDPYYVKGLKIGDRIEKINHKTATPALFTKAVIQGTCGKIALLKINGKIYKLKIRKKKYLFTPLEHFGIVVDKNLTVKKLPNKLYKRYYITPGAKIVKVNGKTVKTFEELKTELSTYKNVTISLIQQGINVTIVLR